MSHSLSPSPAVATSFSTTTTFNKKKTQFPFLAFQSRIISQHDPPNHPKNQGSRITTSMDTRRKMLISGTVVVGMNLLGSHEDNNASAAQRRPPPPPPEEKKDPNVSGVQAKVLASKKRKEAMKEATAKLREKGKPVN